MAFMHVIITRAALLHAQRLPSVQYRHNNGSGTQKRRSNGTGAQ
jgi:hypothetical protein